MSPEARDLGYDLVERTVHFTTVVEVLSGITGDQWSARCSCVDGGLYVSAFRLVTPAALIPWQNCCTTNQNKDWKDGLRKWAHTFLIKEARYINHIPSPSEGPDEMTEWVERPSPVLGDREIQTSWVRILVEPNQWLIKLILVTS